MLYTEAAEKTNEKEQKRSVNLWLIIGKNMLKRKKYIYQCKDKCKTIIVKARYPPKNFCVDLRRDKLYQNKYRKQRYGNRNVLFPNKPFNQ